MLRETHLTAQEETIDKFQFVEMMIKSEGWRKSIVSPQILSRRRQRQAIFWNRGKIAMKQQSKGSKLGQTCGRPKNAIFVQKA